MQLCRYRYLDLYFHLSFIFQNALGITTREVAAFLGHKHEMEPRLPVQNWSQAESDACTGLIGIATAAFGTVASIVFDGAIDRLEDLDDWLRRLKFSLEIFEELTRNAVAAWYAAHWGADDDHFDAEEIIDFVSP